MDKKLKKF